MTSVLIICVGIALFGLLAPNVCTRSLDKQRLEGTGGNPQSKKESTVLSPN